jgi:hypothetical protein
LQKIWEKPLGQLSSATQWNPFVMAGTTPLAALADHAVVS